MSDKSRDQFETYDVGEFLDSPSGGDTVSHETTIDGQVSSIDITSDSPVAVTLKTDNPDGGGDERVIKSYVGDDIDRSDFSGGIAEVGAERDVILEIEDTLSATSVSLNMTVDEWKA